MPDHINYFNDLEDYVEGVLNSLDKSLPKVNSELQDAFLELYYQLDKSSLGTIESSVKNLKIINKYKSKISSLLENGEYGQSVEKYLKGFEGSTGYLNDYFGTIVTAFKANDKLYEAILESNVGSTVDSLLGSGISSNFTDSIFDILKSNVTSGSNKIDFINTLKANLDDETGILSRYVKQVASDSITQFNSNYISTISNDLELKYFFYKGTKIQDTRPFCSRLIGKYLTYDQMKEYVQSQMKLNNNKGWAGMVKGENWSNFPVYRGGYNCRHYLIPISKEIYDAAPESARWAA
jgi:hypothetical protein